MLWIFQTARRMRQMGILGMNRRNAGLILKENPRALFPLVDDKLRMRDLCRRMDIAYAGQKGVREIKAAIRATHGVVIHTQFALFASATGQALPMHERGHHLYNDYAFCNETRPDGTIADANAVWFADWYLDNLNALYSAPLDFELWKSLEARSPIASRLYEFLQLNLYGGTPVYRINYPNLAKLLPVRTERYLSDARKQLGPAIALLQQAGVIESGGWDESRDGLIQLHFTRGPILRAAAPKNAHRDPVLAEDALGSVSVAEIRSTQPAEWHLVRDFYKLWTGEAFTKPTPKELTAARELLERFGRTKLHTLLPLAIKRLKEEWPDAKTFGAIAKYLPEVNDEYDRRQRIAERQKDATLQEELDEKRREQERERQRHIVEEHRAAWQQLSSADREQIEDHIRNTWPHAARVPALFERLCILHFAQTRRASVADASPGDEKSALLPATCDS